MPTYRKKATASRSTLSWDGYRFPRGENVVTEGFIKPHEDLELVSAEPLPMASILLQEEIEFTELTGGSRIINVPYCETYLVQLRVTTGSMVLTEKQVQGAIPIFVEGSLSYLAQIPLKWKNVQQLEVSAAVASSGVLIIERA